MSKLAAVMVAMLAIGPAPAPDDDPTPGGELAALQGTWRATIGPGEDTPLILEIKDARFTLTARPPESEERVLTGELALDAEADPDAMDWKALKADGRELPDNLAIYDLDGDTLKIYSGGHERPAAFPDAGDEIARRRVLVFERQKDEARAES